MDSVCLLIRGSLVRAQQREQNQDQALPRPVGLSCIKALMFYLYILYAASSDKYYVGYSNDYQRRLVEHNHSDSNTFTSRYRPWTIKAVFSCGAIVADAIRIERFIKKQKSRKLIETIIEGKQLTGILAQLVRVPHVRD